MFAQKGDVTVGAKGGYMSKYKDVLYGLDAAYHITDPLEIVVTGLMNPNITLKDELDMSKNKLAVYSASADFRLYLAMQRSWGMGPILGGQYLSVVNKTDDLYNVGVLGFNLGWHIRASLTDNLKINGGWRYTNAKEEMKYHFFYVGLAYTFEMY
ncbi:hypothetical protein FACS1894160_0560 [Bacteroidia bacterium]|nr:hypothetical protein FACS1894123_04780 [Bacteroidia bacterium]GHV07641.1 hypothetical protein FACS1894160_0560 [Bacteroidia bacterium]